MANPSFFLDAFLSLVVSRLCDRPLVFSAEARPDTEVDRRFILSRKADGDWESSESISPSEIRYFRPGVEAMDWKREIGALSSHLNRLKVEGLHIETHSFYSGTVCCANLAPSALIH